MLALIEKPAEYSADLITEGSRITSCVLISNKTSVNTERTWVNDQGQFSCIQYLGSLTSEVLSSLTGRVIVMFLIILLTHSRLLPLWNQRWFFSSITREQHWVWECWNRTEVTCRGELWSIKWHLLLITTKTATLDLSLRQECFFSMIMISGCEMEKISSWRRVMHHCNFFFPFPFWLKGTNALNHSTPPLHGLSKVCPHYSEWQSRMCHTQRLYGRANI